MEKAPVCAEKLRRKIFLLRGKIKNEAAFVAIHTVDIYDDQLWRFANPKALRSSERGHGTGLFFLQVGGDSQRVVLKSSDNLARECLGGFFARFVGVPAPEVRVVDKGCLEWKRIEEILQQGVTINPNLEGRVRKFLQFKGILVMQYIKGKKWIILM